MWPRFVTNQRTGSNKKRRAFLAHLDRRLSDVSERRSQNSVTHKNFGLKCLVKVPMKQIFFIALCERTFKIVVQVLLYFCITLLC